MHTSTRLSNPPARIIIVKIWFTYTEILYVTQYTHSVLIKFAKKIVIIDTIDRHHSDLKVLSALCV